MSDLFCLFIIAPGFNDIEEVTRAAVLLYGLIHARYIITNDGLEAMKVKYLSKDFGECPRLLCRGHSVVPMGTTDEPKQSHVKLFCPKCKDAYNGSIMHRDIDGAFFGPTFPNLFFMTFTDLIPENKVELHVPRVFGFKINNSNALRSSSSNNSLETSLPNRQFITKSKSNCGDDDDSSNDIPNKRSYETMENDNKVISVGLNESSTIENDNKVIINSKRKKSSLKNVSSSSKN